MAAQTQTRPATVTIAGEQLTFWHFVASMLFAYFVSVLALLLGPLGALICMLLSTFTTALFAWGLVLFFLQRPGTGLVVLAVLGAIQFALLEYGIDGGLFWLVWSREGLEWIESKGF